MTIEPYWSVSLREDAEKGGFQPDNVIAAATALMRHVERSTGHTVFYVWHANYDIRDNRYYGRIGAIAVN